MSGSAAGGGALPPGLPAPERHHGRLREEKPAQVTFLPPWRHFRGLPGVFREKPIGRGRDRQTESPRGAADGRPRPPETRLREAPPGLERTGGDGQSSPADSERRGETRGGGKPPEAPD